MSIGVLLTIVFFVCHVAGWIHWSWWLVFLPLILEVVIDILFWSGVIALIRKVLD